MRQAGLCVIYLVAPTTPEERIELIVKRATGFVYYVSREGVTGMQAKVSDTIGQMTARIRAHTDLPIAVGFGISTPEQARSRGGVRRRGGGGQRGGQSDRAPRPIARFGSARDGVHRRADPGRQTARPKMKPNAKRRESKHAPMLLKDEQIAMLEIPVAERRKKVTVLPVDMESPEQRERARLENKYSGLFEQRPDCRRLVTYVLNKTLPLYNWFKYKEGFSRELVVRLFREFALQKGDTVFDPFLGCGTTLLAGKEFGIHGVGIDMLPTSVFVAQAKLTEWPDIDLLLRAIQKLTSTPFREPTSNFPDVRIVNLAFTRETQRELIFFKEEIEAFDQPVRKFLMLGLLSILENVSSTSKDGQFLRLVERKIPPVRDALRSVLAQMIADLSEIRMFGFPAQTRTKTLVMQGDAREMCLPGKYVGKVSAVITSPPYLNRYDYSRTYALELCLLTVKSHQDMVNVRHSLLRSHVESREHDGKGD